MDLEITFPGGKRVDAQFADYRVETDQPLSAGGEGSAPSPFDLFLTSIGTCAGFYALNFCHKRDIPTADMRLRQRHNFDPSTGKVEAIEIEIDLPPDFPEQYLEALIRAADLCAVKKHLADPPDVRVMSS